MSKYFFVFLLLISIFFSSEIAFAQSEKTTILKVPFTSEIPNGSWVAPWNNACEEASIVMVKGYYFGYETVTKKIAAADMAPFFKIEDKLFGSNADTDAARTAKLINDHTDIVAKVVTNPSLEKIKNEIDNARPVIALLNMKKIVNKNHRFRAGGSYYHVFVIIGYDDKTSEFITHDNGDEKTGKELRYTYNEIMENLHDFNHKTKRADGPARVLFTDSKILFKVKGDQKIYLVNHDTKFHITSSDVFKKKGYNWKKIRVVDQKRLDNLKVGDPISA